jgi:hypothetical protein
VSVFGSVVAVVFQNIFHLEMHQNNIFFYFLKIIFDINTHQNDLKTPKKY